MDWTTNCRVAAKMKAEWRRAGGTMFAGMPLAERLDLWADVAEHNRKAKAIAQ